MSTPIEIVRAYLDTRVKMWGTQNDVDLDLALAAVLRDAERYRKLEVRTWGHTHYIGMSRDDGNGHMLVWGDGRTLAELADKSKGS